MAAGIRTRLRRIAIRLGLGQAVVGTALTYLHRCRAQWQRTGESRPVAREHELALACLFLAAKIEENPQRMRDVLNVAHLIEYKVVLRDSHVYWQLKEQLVRDEQLVLRDIGFDLRAPRVHRYMLAAAHTLHLAPAVVQLASDVVNDSFAEPLTLRFSDDAIATSAIAIAHAAACSVGAHGAEPLHAHWWEALGIAQAELKACLIELVPLCDLLDVRAGALGDGSFSDGGSSAELAQLVLQAVEAVCAEGVFGARAALDRASAAASRAEPRDANTLDLPAVDACDRRVVLAAFDCRAADSDATRGAIGDIADASHARDLSTVDASEGSRIGIAHLRELS